jgi:fermentation-respiration switch protein FrsA (DUF1100 family)
MMWTVIGAVALLCVGLVLLLFLFQARLVFFPTRAYQSTPAVAGLDFDQVFFETEDGLTLSGWFVPADQAENVVLFFHGNAGNISHRIESIAQFHRLGSSVFIIDYRGYGQSEGSPSEEGIYRDAAAAWRYLVEEQLIAPERIVIFGRSLGGGAATWLAANQSPQALILESTFTSIPDIGAQRFPFLPVRQLSRIRFNSLARLPSITVPVLIIHSPDDRVIPYDHGQQLFQAANEPKRFLQIRGDHNEGHIITGAPYEAGLAGFLKRHP